MRHNLIKLLILLPLKADLLCTLQYEIPCSCYLASYNTTGRGLSGDWIDSSEQLSYQNLEEMEYFIQMYDVAYCYDCGLLSPDDVKDWTKWIYKSDSSPVFNFYR